MFVDKKHKMQLCIIFQLNQSQVRKNHENKNPAAVEREEVNQGKINFTYFLLITIRAQLTSPSSIILF